MYVNIQVSTGGNTCVSNYPSGVYFSAVMECLLKEISGTNQIIDDWREFKTTMTSTLHVTTTTVFIEMLWGSV